MKRLFRWLAARGWKVVPGNEWCADLDTKTITAPRRGSRQLRTIMLLHECGHVLCAPRWHGKPASAIETLHEELEAWYRGWRLGRRLGVRVSHRAYVQERDWRVRHYAWMAQRPAVRERYERMMG